MVSLIVAICSCEVCECACVYEGKEARVEVDAGRLPCHRAFANFAPFFFVWLDSTRFELRMEFEKEIGVAFPNPAYKNRVKLNSAIHPAHDRYACNHGGSKGYVPIDFGLGKHPL